MRARDLHKQRLTVGETRPKGWHSVSKFVARHMFYGYSVSQSSVVIAFPCVTESQTMVGTLSGSYSASLPRLAGASTAANSRAEQATSLLSRLQKTDPEKAEEISKKLTEAHNASAQLSAAEIDQNAERKAAAMEKIQRIKEQLKALRMLGSGDPKAMARQAARLSRELAAAVKEYAAANGGKAPAGSFTSSPAASTGTSQDAQTTDAAPTEAAGGETISQPATSPEAPSAETGGTGETDEGAAAAETGPETPEEIREEDQKQREEEPFSPVPSDSSGKTTTGFSLSDPHATFKELVRSVEEEIKKILESAKSQLRVQEDRNLRRDVDDIEKSLGEVEQDLTTLPGPVLALAATTSATPPAAAPVNILA